MIKILVSLFTFITMSTISPAFAVQLQTPIAPDQSDEAAAKPAARPAARPPRQLAIYYGYPSLINRANGNLKQVVAQFANYNLIVLGDGLEFNDIDNSRKPVGVGILEHNFTRRLIQALKKRGPSNKHRAIELYGYVDLGNTQHLGLVELKRRVQLWAEMGVDGIFLDEAGYDFGVTRARQNSIVEYIHQLKLSAFLNAFNVDDLFSSAAVPLNRAGGGNPDGLGAQLGAEDLFLLESFQIRNGSFDDSDESFARIKRAVEFRAETGARIYAVTTLLPGQHFSRLQYDYGWWNAQLWGLDGFGWGEPNFSADNSLPLREPLRLPELGNFLSPVVKAEHSLSRETSRGKIVIDMRTHMGRLVEE